MSSRRVHIQPYIRMYVHVHVRTHTPTDRRVAIGPNHLDSPHPPPTTTAAALSTTLGLTRWAEQGRGERHARSHVPRERRGDAAAEFATARPVARSRPGPPVGVPAATRDGHLVGTASGAELAGGERLLTTSGAVRRGPGAETQLHVGNWSVWGSGGSGDQRRAAGEPAVRRGLASCIVMKVCVEGCRSVVLWTRRSRRRQSCAAAVAQVYRGGGHALGSSRMVARPTLAAFVWCRSFRGIVAEWNSAVAAQNAAESSQRCHFPSC